MYLIILESESEVKSISDSNLNLNFRIDPRFALDLRITVCNITHVNGDMSMMYLFFAPFANISILIKLMVT